MGKPMILWAQIDGNFRSPMMSADSTDDEIQRVSESEGDQSATSRLAVASLLSGIMGWLPGIGLVAAILGVIALNQITNPANRLKGRGFAVAGVMLGDSMTLLLVAAGVLLPMIASARRAELRMTNNTLVRGIHQAMVQYSQGNRGFYPGLGNDNSPTVEGRYQILLVANFITPEYAISPIDADKVPARLPMPVTTRNYSYAMSQIATPGARRAAWSSLPNDESPVICDRNTGAGPGTLARSIHCHTQWRGSIAFNDNHTLFETYNSDGAPSNVLGGDDLFATTGPDDYYMINSGK